MRAGTKLLGIVSPLLLAAAVASIVPLAPPAGAQEPTEVRFSWWGGQLRNEKTDKILQLFESEHPAVRMIRENSDWLPHWDKLTVQAAAGNQPCTIQMQTRWLATYAKPEILRPLDDLVASGKLDVSGIARPVIESSRGADGNLYMIPSGVFYFALMYNKTMLEEAGLEPPAADWTWSDFAQLIHDIAPKLPEGVNPTHNMGRETDSFVTWVQTQSYPMFEGNQIAFPDDVTARWFDFWEKLRQDGLTDSPEGAIADNGSLIEESNIANGRTFITNRPPNRLDSHQQVMDAVRPGEQLTIHPYPRAEDGTTGMDLGANGIAIGATCPEQKIPVAADWINFFTQDPRAAAIYESDNGVVAVDKFQDEQANGPNTSRGQREQIILFQKVAPDAKPVDWPAGGYAAVTEALGRAYDAVAFETLSSEEAAAQFAGEMKELLH